MIKWFKKLLVIIILILITFLINKKDIVYSELEVNYLKNHVDYIQVEEPTFNLLQEDINKYQAFITSEIHGVKANDAYEYNLFKYLHQHAEVHFLLLEISFSSGYLLNEYVQSGNEDLLKTVFSFYKGTTFWTQEEYQFFQNLYHYNQNLPASKKITIIGIDIEHSLDSYLYLIDTYPISKELIIHLNNNKEYHDLFYANLEPNWQMREDQLYKNYIYLSQLYQIDKFFGQFGTIHCFKERINDDFKSLTYYLNEDSQSNVKSHVLVIMTLYYDSEYLTVMKSNHLNFYRSKKINNYLNNGIDYFEKSNDIMFNLNEDYSPYQSHLIWFFEQYHVKNDNTVTTDYFDYILLINHSESSVPLEASDSFIEVFMDSLKLK